MYNGAIVVLILVIIWLSAELADKSQNSKRKDKQIIFLMDRIQSLKKLMQDNGIV